MRLVVLLACISLATLALVACAARRTVAYRLNSLPSGWTRVHLKDAHQVFHHDQGGAILANSSCRASDADAPLDVLTNHLLFELDEVREQGREPRVIDGRAALRTRLTAKLDGVPVALDLVVLKKDGCTVDLQLVTAPEQASARERDFARFVDGFKLKGDGE
jgi:hypothetical protein